MLGKLRPPSAISPERLNGLTILLLGLLTLLTVGFAAGIVLEFRGIVPGAGGVAWFCVLAGLFTLVGLLRLTEGRQRQLKLTIDLLVILTTTGALLFVLAFLATAVLKIAGL